MAHLFSAVNLGMLQQPMLGGNSQPQFYSGQTQGLPANGPPGFSSQPNYLSQPQTDSMGLFTYPNILQGQQHPGSQFLSPAVRYPQFPYFPFNPPSSPFLAMCLNQSPSNLEAEFSAADQQLLAQTLRDNKKTKTLAEIFASLNGVNNRSAEQWMIFYITNSNKVDELQMRRNESDKPTIASEPVEIPCTTRRADRALQNHHPHRPSAGKKTLSSLWKPGRSSARLPTPPNHVVRLASGKGNKFTEEDKKFFVRILGCLLTHNPRMKNSSKEIVSELVKGAPHHTPASWRSWISSNVEEIRALRREILKQENVSVEWHSSEESNRRDESEVDADDAELKSGGASELERTESVCLSSSENESDSEIGTPDLRNTYLPSEKRALAKFIADMTLAKWERTTGAVRWKLFEAKQPGHTAKAWKEWYARNKADVIREAKRLASRKARRQAESRYNDQRSSSRGRQNGRPRAASAALQKRGSDKKTPQSGQAARRSKRFQVLSYPIKVSSSPTPVLVGSQIIG